MNEKIHRRPFAHFFVKKSMQIRIIAKILFAIVVSTVITTLILTVIYTMKSQHGSFYYMSNNIMEDLKLHSLLGLVLPALVAAQIAGVLITLAIGFFLSRKIAVPLYKIERWAEQIRQGNLKTSLAFREPEQMQELTDRCNSMAAAYREIFNSIRQSVEVIALKKEEPTAITAETMKLKNILEKIRF